MGLFVVTILQGKGRFSLTIAVERMEFSLHRPRRDDMMRHYPAETSDRGASPMTSQSTLCSRLSLIAIFLFASSTTVEAQTAATKANPTGSISGRITIDGKPAAGIPVAAVEGQSVNRRDAPACAFSDVEGNYHISGLKSGEYQVWTLTPSMVAEPAAPNYSSYPGTAKSVLLAADENVTGVDLKLIRWTIGCW